MNVVLWILQWVLATPAWVEDFSPATVRFIGVVEILGALGLVLPALTGITPILTPLAATRS